MPKLNGRFSIVKNMSHINVFFSLKKYHVLIIRIHSKLKTYRILAIVLHSFLEPCCLEPKQLFHPIVSPKIKYSTKHFLLSQYHND